MGFWKESRSRKISGFPVQQEPPAPPSARADDRRLQPTSAGPSQHREPPAPSSAGADGSRLQPIATGLSQRHEHRSPREHAVALIEHLQCQTYDETTYLISEEMQAIHIEVCKKRGWWPRKWAPVAREYRRLANNDRKIYIRLVDAGMVRSLRVYHLPYLPTGGGHVSS